ncbi:hypothetical protein AgCh_024027 [Apium graveolens]
MTPYEAWSNSKQDVAHMRVFGCLGHMRIPSKGMKKLDDRSLPVIHLGREPGIKGYCLYNPEKQKVYVVDCRICGDPNSLIRFEFVKFTDEGVPRPPSDQSSQLSQTDSSFRSPFSHRNGLNGKLYGDLSQLNIDISFVSSGRPSTDGMFPSFGESFDMSSTPPRLSNMLDGDNQGFDFGRMSVDTATATELSYSSSDGGSSASQPMKSFRKSEGKGGKSDRGDYIYVKCYNCGEKCYISPDCKKMRSDKGKALVTKKKS